jgi:hypothetical protein
MTDTESEPIDTTDAEDAQLLLADPDDYHRSQRLKQIHDARRKVHDTTHQSNDIREVKNAVVLYGIELLPLIRDTDFDTSLPDGLAWDSIGGYITRHGEVPRGETNYLNYHMIVFQRLNDALAEVRPLIEEDETDEWEV